MNLTCTSHKGSPRPPGVTPALDGRGLNFALCSSSASRVNLVLEIEGSRIELSLDPQVNRTGHVWHLQIEELPAGFAYGWRVEGGAGSDFSRILLDPYCRTLRPRRWGEPAAYGSEPCCLFQPDSFDWQGVTKPRTPRTQSVIYELHVRGFTRKAAVQCPGTFAGLLEKLPWLQQLGITAVELLPVTAFDENDTPFTGPNGEPLKNYWGYNPLSLFALHSGYASRPEKAVCEFKTMVREFHRAGIEIYLDLVFNHTGEGGNGGNTCCFRGVDNSTWYLLDGAGRNMNYSGCGNTINCNHPVVRQALAEALRYWALEMQVDGFRFDLASIFSRGRDGEPLAKAPLIELIEEDPLLADVKLIAEAWDAAGLYQVGNFSESGRWSEWNGRFRDDVRSFMAGNRNTVSNLATRIAGSSDLFEWSGRRPVNSINFITSHDGFTLHDLVSYNGKHNEANGESNRDGDNHNLSWNSGVEGPDDAPAIRSLRLRRMKSLQMLLLLSQGVPMLTAGDEMARTQQGNNNAWAQDNELSWLDWSLVETEAELLHFVRELIALRSRHGIFGRDEFFAPETSLTSIEWQYLQPGVPDWSGDSNGLAFLLKSDETAWQRDCFFLMFNGSRQQGLEFTLPMPPEVQSWHLLFSSVAPAPRDCMPQRTRNNLLRANSFYLPPFGGALLQAQLYPPGGTSI